MSNETKLELAAVEAYLAEQEQRKREMLHWIAEEMWEAFGL